MSVLPKISVIMPVLNREHTIRKALQSVVDQQYPQVELIVLDGGSKDRTVDIIKEFHEHIAYWHSEYDGDPSTAVNFGIGKATGDLVALLMADDWYEPDTLAKIASAYQANPDVDMLTCGGSVLRYSAESKQYETVMSFIEAKDLYLSFFNICFASSAICCRFIRKSWYDQIGTYLSRDNNGKHIFSNDKEFLLRSVMHGVKDVFIEHVGYRYLAHQGSSTFGSNHKNLVRMCEEHIVLAEMLLQRPNIKWHHRLFLAYWYSDQCVRVMLFKLLEKDVRSAVAAVKKGMSRYYLAWPLMAIVSLSFIFGRKLKRRLV